MSQNTQQYPQTGTELQSLPAAGDDTSLGQVDTLKIVACPICRAIYIPSAEARVRASATLLETAFLNVCHFCFRCQRPACPQCWNPVHHTCASCSEEANLPFRSPVPSLEGLVFLPLTTASTTPASTISFTCHRNGRFCTANQFSLAQPLRKNLPTVTCEPVTSDALPVLPPTYTVPAPVSTHISSYPTWLQETYSQKTNGQTVLPLTTAMPQSYTLQERPADLQMSSAHLANLDHTSPTNWPQIAAFTQQPTNPAPLRIPSALALQPPPPTLPTPITEQQYETTLHDDVDDEDISVAERVENVLIVITSIILLSVVLMIVLSICFAQVNAFLLGLLHIDIRTEIAYLLQLR